MPLRARQVQPTVAACRQLPSGTTEELSCAATFALTNLIRQIGDVAKLAEDIMSSVIGRLEEFSQRSGKLEGRLEKIREHVAGFDVEKEVLGGKTFKLTSCHYQSRQPSSQRAIVKQPPPTNLAEVYDRADPIPLLRQFRGMREDGMNPEKMISDPSFFFEHWRHQFHSSSQKRKSISIALERDPSVDADVVVSDDTPPSTRSPKPRSPDLLLETLNPQSSIHRRRKTQCPTIPQRYGDSLPISAMKEQERKTVFELFEVDIPTRCSSSLAVEQGDSQTTPLATPTNGINHDRESATPMTIKSTTVTPTPHHQLDLSSGKILYQDEDCLVIVPVTPEKVKRRFTFSGLRKSFRRSGKDKSENSKKSGGSLKRRSSLRNSFRRRSSKKEATPEVVAENNGMLSDHGTMEMPPDSGVDTASSRTTSVSSAGNLGYSLKHSQEETIQPKGSVVTTHVPPAPPPPPIPSVHYTSASLVQNRKSISIPPELSPVRTPPGAHSSGHAHSLSPLVQGQSFTLPNHTPVTVGFYGNSVQSTPVQVVAPCPPPSTDVSVTAAETLHVVDREVTQPFKRFSLSSTQPIAFNVDRDAPQISVGPVKLTPKHHADNEILRAIESGIKGRKAQKQSKNSLPYDVAAILERRLAIMCSDDDSDSTGDEWDD